MSTRRAVLRSYFLEVVRDLVERGEVRRQQGQSLDDILRVEASRVIREVQADFTAIAVEMGYGLANAAECYVQNLVGAGVRALSDVLGKRR